MILAPHSVDGRSSRVMLGNCSASRRLLSPKPTAVIGISRSTVCRCSSVGTGVGISRGYLLPGQAHPLHQLPLCHGPLRTDSTPSSSSSSTACSRGSSSIARARRNKGSYLFQVEDESPDGKVQTFQTEQAMLARYNSLLKESNLLKDLKSRSRFERPRDKLKRQHQERIEMRKWQNKQEQGFVPESLESAGGPDQKLEEPFFEYFEMRAPWDKVIDHDDLAVAAQAGGNNQQLQDDYGYYAYNPNGVIDIDMGGYLPGSSAGPAASPSVTQQYQGYLATGSAAWNAAGFDGSYSAAAAAPADNLTGGYINSNAAAGAAADNGGGFLDMQQLAAPMQESYQQSWQQQQQQQPSAADLVDPATGAGAVWAQWLSSTTGQYMDPALGTAASTYQQQQQQQQQQFQQVWADLSGQQQEAQQQEWAAPISQQQQWQQQQQVFQQVWGNIYATEQEQQQQQQQQSWLPLAGPSAVVSPDVAPGRDALAAAEAVAAALPTSIPPPAAAAAAAAAVPELPVIGLAGDVAEVFAGGSVNMAAVTAEAQQQSALAREVAATQAAAAQAAAAAVQLTSSGPPPVVQDDVGAKVVNADSTGFEATAPASVSSWVVVEAAPAAEVGLAWSSSGQLWQTEGSSEEAQLPLSQWQQQQQQLEEEQQQQQQQPPSTQWTADFLEVVSDRHAENSSFDVREANDVPRSAADPVVPAAADHWPDGSSRPPRSRSQQNRQQQGKGRKMNMKPPATAAAADGTEAPLVAAVKGARRGRPPQGRQQQQQQATKEVSAVADVQMPPAAVSASPAAVGPSFSAAAAAAAVRDAQAALAASMGTTQALHQLLTAHTNGSSSSNGSSNSNSSNNAHNKSSGSGSATPGGVPVANSSPDRSESPGRFRRIQRRRRSTGSSDNSGSSAGGSNSTSGADARGTDETGSRGVYRRGNYGGSRGLQGPIVLDAVSSEDDSSSSSNGSSSHHQQSHQQRDSTAAV